MSTEATPEPVATVSPAIEAPGGAAIQTINAAEAKPSAVTIVEAPKSPQMPEARKLSVKEFLQRKGDTDSKISLEKLDEKGRERDPATGKFVKQPKAKPAKTVPAVKPNAPQAEAPAPTETVAAEPTLPAPVSKIKVGDQEMTEEEVQAHIAKLEAAAKAPPAAEAPKAPEPPAKPAEPAPAPAAPTPEEIKAREDAFIAEHAKFFALTAEDMPTQQKIDEFLASGKPELFAEILTTATAKLAAKIHMRDRQFMAEQVNPHFDRLQQNLEPVMSQQQQIREYQAERDFLSLPQHKDIADAPDASKALREAGAQLHEEYDAYHAFKSQGQTIPSFLAKAAAYEGEGWAPALAARTRQIIASRAPVAPAAPATPPAAPIAPKPAPRPAPPGGQPTGAGGATAPVSSQQAVLARVRGKY